MDKAWAHRMLLLRAGDTLSANATRRLAEFFAADDPTGARSGVEGQGAAADTAAHELPRAVAAAAKEDLKVLVEAAARPETNKLYRTVCRWWKGIQVLIVTGATTGKVEANNTATKNIKRTARGYRIPANYKSAILWRSADRTAA